MVTNLIDKTELVFVQTMLEWMDLSFGLSQLNAQMTTSVCIRVTLRLKPGNIASNAVLEALQSMEDYLGNHPSLTLACRGGWILQTLCRTCHNKCMHCV